MEGAKVIFDGTREMLDEKWTSINQVWGRANSGIDGGKGITDTPGGLKLQCEGHEVLYRNIWIEELELTEADTDFLE